MGHKGENKRAKWKRKNWNRKTNMSKKTYVYSACCNKYNLVYFDWKCIWWRGLTNRYWPGTTNGLLHSLSLTLLFPLQELTIIHHNNLFLSLLLSKMARATDKKYDHLFQLLLCGDSSVGKTCLISRFADNEFRHTHINTIGKWLQLVSVCVCAYGEQLLLSC